MMTAQCDDSFSRPMIPTSCFESVSIQHAGDKIIRTDSRQDGHSFNECFWRMAVALTTAPTGQAQFRMRASFPVDDQDNFACCTVHLGDDFVNESPHNPLLQTY